MDLLGTLKSRIGFGTATSVGGLAMADEDVSPLEAGLYLIGMGPGRMELMTSRALRTARRCDDRLYEAYTALWPEHELQRLEKHIGPIERVMRPAIEQPEELLQRAKTASIGVLVVGDPLQATTHVDLQLRCLEQGVACHIEHGLSITTLASGTSGLSNYKFGRQTTLTYPHGSWIATSPLEVIMLNKTNGFHTLVLLDLDPTGQGVGQQQPMTPSDAHNALQLMKQKLLEANNDEVLDAFDTWTAIVCSDLGCEDEAMYTTTIGQLSSVEGGRLNTILIPGSMSDIEKSAISRWNVEVK